MTVAELIVIGGVLSAVPIGLFYGTSQDTVTFTVTEKERVEERYLVFSEDEVFENTDNLFVLKMNSSDVYRRIQDGDTCTARVIGWRVPLLSWYRNILSADCNKEG